MRPSMPFPNGERVFDLWEQSRRAAVEPHSAELPVPGRRRRVLPATFGLTVAMRLVPLVFIVLGLLLFEARG